MSDKKKKEAAAAPKKTIGSVACDAIRAGKTNGDALAVVMKVFPEAKTSLASINWYRNKLRGAGEKVPTARELKKKDPKKGAKKSGDPLE